MDLTSSYVFDAAHRITGHPGKCAWLHGHTYHLEVTVSSLTLNPLGMVMDFDDLRDVVRKAVLDRWDHATLLAANDPLGPAVRAVQYPDCVRIGYFDCFSGVSGDMVLGGRPTGRRQKENK